MDKKTFFDQLDKDFAVKYEKYYLQPRDISVIRHYFIGRKLSFQQVTDLIKEKLPRMTAGKRLDRNQRILAFLSKCTNEEITEITKLTEFDRDREAGN